MVLLRVLSMVMADPVPDVQKPTESTFQTRLEALQVRVNKAALALHERNVRPTVTRIRAALGGGSPNDLGPALKRWREELLPTLKGGEGMNPTAVPPVIADIVAELWSRARSAAAVEATGGSAARFKIARTEEANALREEVQRLRDQLQREQLAYGELRAQSARHEAIALAAVGRSRESENRERTLVRKLAEATARIEQLQAASEERRVSARTGAAKALVRSPRRKLANRSKRRAVRTTGVVVSKRTLTPASNARSKKKRSRTK